MGFRFVTKAHTNIDDYVFTACMEKVMPVVEKAAEKNLEIRNLVLGTHQIDKTNQVNLVFTDETEHVARLKTVNEIKNRFAENNSPK